MLQKLNKRITDQDIYNNYATLPNAAHVAIAQTGNLILAVNFPIAIALRTYP